ncbi:unnamed protein product [Parascedosporium putredinis]|uniref:Uncharacterized protein n=1 Tax=Parascedosporium putredinis TaxID=1442378 RepID=A0A9P1H167_9PEZI|nr:unnamed protein product [Parascedosporium putredinis]CAI7993468.1 unnamed protein product [Parascedosporium putredinis]
MASEPWLAITTSVLAGVASIFLGLRFIGKWWLQRRVWWDDGLIVASWALFIGCLALIIRLTVSVNGDNSTESWIEASASSLMGPIRTTLAVVSIAWAKSAFVLS